MQTFHFSDVSSNEELLLVREKISKIDFGQLRGYDVATILSTPFFSWDKEKIRIINLVKDIVKSLFFYENVIVNPGEEVLFFESIEYLERNTYQQMLRKVEECVERKWIVRPEKKIRFYLGSIKYWLIFCEWKKKINHVLKNSRLSLYLSLCLLRAYVELEKFKNTIKGISPDVIVTFCDVLPVDAMIVQWARKNKIKTVTLQHGHFNASDRGWVFGRSKSDFFLLQGKYARDQALKSGHPEKGLKTVGMMSYIGKSRKEMQALQHDKTSFAVLLNGPGAKEDNPGFVKCADEIAEKYGLQYIIRVHPALRREEYEVFFSSDYCCGESKQSESIEQLVSKTQFVLVGNSTMFIETLYVGGVVFRYLGYSQDIYDGIGWCAFRDATEFGTIYDKCVLNSTYLKEKVNESLEQLCAPGDIAHNYTMAFEEILQEEITYENTRGDTSKI